jgi:DNA-binding PadR family transcriptional regulator
MAMIQEAVLGLLAREPSHGYALWQTLQSWSVDETIQTSSVYMAIKRLADAEAIEVVALGPAPKHGERPRHTFAITETGRDRLNRWLSQRPVTVEDLRLRIAIAQPADDLGVLIEWVAQAMVETQRRLGSAAGGAGAAPAIEDAANWDSVCALAMSTLSFHELSARAVWLAEAHAQLRRLHDLAASTQRGS